SALRRNSFSSRSIASSVELAEPRGLVEVSITGSALGGSALGGSATGGSATGDTSSLRSQAGIPPAGGEIGTGAVYDATCAARAAASASSSKSPDAEASAAESSIGGVYVDRRTPDGTYGSESFPGTPVPGTSFMLGF